MEETVTGAGETGGTGETGAKKGGETGQDNDLVASRVGRIVGSTPYGRFFKSHYFFWVLCTQTPSGQLTNKKVRNLSYLLTTSKKCSG